ncbi:MAG: alkyl sulfatase C-terminal domain-containing protein [Candidatus Nanopelagicales bacterium]
MRPSFVGVVTPDSGETLVVEVSNGTLTSPQGFTAANSDLTLTIKRSDLDAVMRRD